MTAKEKEMETLNKIEQKILKQIDRDIEKHKEAIKQLQAARLRLVAR